MDDNELIQWYKRVFDEYPSVGLLAFIREVMEQPAATAPIPVYAEHAEKPVAYVADEQPAPAPNANELLPCPHCGETNIDATSYTDSSEYWMIYCPSCRILMDVVNRTKDEAFALWNKRVAAAPVPALEYVPNGYYPYPEPIHAREGVKVGPGYVQLVGYNKSLEAIRLHPDWLLMRPATAAGEEE